MIRDTSCFTGRRLWTCEPPCLASGHGTRFVRNFGSERFGFWRPISLTHPIIEYSDRERVEKQVVDQSSHVSTTRGTRAESFSSSLNERVMHSHKAIALSTFDTALLWTHDEDQISLDVAVSSQLEHPCRCQIRLVPLHILILAFSTAGMTSTDHVLLIQPILIVLARFGQAKHLRGKS